MFRKLAIAFGATAVIAAAALAPTAASAHHWHGYHGWHGGFGIYAPAYVGGPDCYVVRRVVDTAYGPRIRRVTVCD